MYIPQETAERIKIIAKQRKKSIATVLTEAGIGKNTITKMTSGSDIFVQSIYKIAERLECSVDFLLGRSQNVNAHIENIDIEDISEEQRLVIAFHKLTDEGKTRILDEAEMYANNPKFQKYTDIPKEA